MKSLNSKIPVPQSLLALRKIAVHDGVEIDDSHYYGYIHFGTEWWAFNDQLKPSIWVVEGAREVIKSLKQGRKSAYGLLYEKRI